MFNVFKSFPFSGISGFRFDEDEIKKNPPAPVKMLNLRMSARIATRNVMAVDPVKETKLIFLPVKINGIYKVFFTLSRVIFGFH